VTWLDLLIHLVNLVVPAFGVAVLGAALAKLAWRRELAGRPWLVLAAWSFAAGVVITLGGLAIFGQDGRMATYVALCAGCAATLWWLGFVRR
jgi:hypothetical protein